MEHETCLRSLYAAFNARDIDAALATMTADVDWPNDWEGGRVVDYDQIRDEALLIEVRLHNYRTQLIRRVLSETKTLVNGLATTTGCVATRESTRARSGLAISSS